MGFIHEGHGPREICVESRSESFILYSNDLETEAPEFLLEDVPNVLRALADLSMCPPAVKAAIQQAAT